MQYGLAKGGSCLISNIARAVEEVCGSNFTGVFDRGYDDNKIFNYMTRNEHKFVVRLYDQRKLLFKGKKRSVEEVSN